MEGKVVDPDEDEEESSEEEEEEEEDKEDSTSDKGTNKKRKPKVGDILNYTKEVDVYVLDEEGNRILCKDMKEAKVLSLLFEIKQMLIKKKKNG